MKKTTSKNVTDIHDAEREKLHQRGFQRVDDPSESLSKTSTWKVLKSSASKKPNFMPQNLETNEPSSSLFCDKCHFYLIEPVKNITLPCTYLPVTKASSAKSSLDNNQTTSSFMTQLSGNIP